VTAKLLTLAALCGGLAAASDALVLTSPNGAVRFRILLDQQHLTYDVTLRGKPVIDASPLGIVVDGVNLCDSARGGKPTTYKTDTTYSTYGVHATATDKSNAGRLPATHIASGNAFVVEARAYDNGVAFRYLVPGPADRSRTPDEATAFRIPAGSTAWYHDVEGHYEGDYHKYAFEQIGPSVAAPPVTFRLPNGGGYGSITEGGLRHYAGMALEGAADHSLRAILGHAEPVSYPFALRYEKADWERLAIPAAIQGLITTPWRIVLAAPDLNTLVNADIVTNVSDPPDPKYFPQGVQTPWLKPGRAVWRYLDGGQNNFEGMKEFSRLAGQLGFEYHVVEGLWRNWSPEQLKEFCDYSRQQGVGPILWAFRRDLGTPEQRKTFFDRLERAGAAGAKIDFFDHEAKEVVDLYDDLLREAAARHMVLDFHGANKPTGLSRTWPNELTREGIRGMESSRSLRAEHQTTLLFGRMLAGGADYTPMLFGARRHDTTIANQIASAAMITSPLLVFAANPATILDNPAAEVIKSIPSVWDETIVLPPSEIGEFAAYARRRGTTWFLAVMNGPTPRQVDLPLTFLGSGKYHSVEVRDAAGDTVELKRGESTRATSIHLDLPTGGGSLVRLTP
jgi:alpha-glucosidase